MAETTRSNFPGIPKLHLLLLWIVSLIPVVLEAQSYEILDFISGNIPVENQNWDISQDPVSGFIYFANSGGLVEYNGISSRTYQMPFRQSIRSVFINSSGKIFSGSFEDFGFWQKDDEKGLVYKSLTQNLTIPKNDEIWKIYENNNSIYFQSFTTIYKYDYDRVVPVTGPAAMLFMFRAGDRFIVQVLGQGLFWFDGKEFSPVSKSELFSWIKVHAIVPRGRGVYWICTANDGIYVYDGKSFNYLKSEISDYLKNQTCNGSISINDSLIAFGTILRGVVFCDKYGKITKSYNYANGLKNNTVLSLYKDSDNALWAGLDDGASYLSLSSAITQFLNTSGTLGTIYSIIRKDSSLYLGTNHGLFVTGIRSNQGDYSFPGLHIIPNTHGQVWKLAEFDGQILCGHNEGTYLLDNGSFRRISNVTGGWTMKRYNEFIIQGTYTGIIVLGKDTEGKWNFRNTINGYREPTRYLDVDYLGYVWAVHPQKGIDRLELNEAMDSVINVIHFNSVGDTTGKITVSQINNQVVFTNSGYIYAFNNESKTFSPLRSLEPGLGEYIKSTQIINYQKNSYWFVLGNRIGLFEITKDLEAKKILELYHNFTELPGREQQIISLENNSLLIPTRQAFTIFNLDRLKEVKNRHSLSISTMIFSGKAKTIAVIPDSAIMPEIPNRANNLTVHLANPSMFEKESKEYLYRIKELGDQWYRTSLDNFPFLNLKSGNYTLQVKTSVGTGMDEAGFTIKKPRYLSTGAILLYLFLVSGLIAMGIRIFRITLDRHRKMIEYEVGKNRLESELDFKSYELMMTMRYLIRKTDILRELHDKLDALKEYSSKFPVKYIREMEKIIDNGLDSQTEEWQNVMRNLKLSQEGFFRKLKDKYPELTPNDLRLCSYLRMNFTTKEIANLVSISSRAVEIGRYRLRRKMNLSHDVNLTEFLIKEAESV
jgi:ligand-binding sensor domain-containing protein/DNA-binding CsgD family transcriptional regulator